jgi:hypothetical protein
MTDSKEEFKIKPLTKDILIKVSGVTKNYFIRRMKVLEKDLLKEFPRYKKSSSILPDKIFFWLCDEFGVEKEIAVTRIIELIPEFKNENIEKIKKMYGLNKENRFISNQITSNRTNNIQ